MIYFLKKILKKSPALFFLLSIIIFPIFSESNQQNSSYSLLFYGGPFVNSDLLPIVLQGDIAYKKSFIGMVGLNKQINLKYKNIDFEVEGLIGKHAGVMKHFEADGVLIGRIPNLFNLPISFAAGEGLSLASQNPVMENKLKGFDRGFFTTYDVQSRQLLNFLIFELDYTFNSAPANPRLFIRLHHRSGIWGTFCPPDPPCGSNFITYGIKVSL